MLTRRVELRVTAEVRDAIEQARGDVALNRWVTRAIEERLRAQGYELDLNREPAEVVPIRPSMTAEAKRRTSKLSENRHRAPAAGTWRRG
jgi:hypothetical protein